MLLSSPSACPPSTGPVFPAWERRCAQFFVSSCSWSEAWGEQGYIRLLKGADNHCGVASQASFPLL